MSIVSAKVTSKGQITLPAEMRAELGIQAGDRVEFEKNANGRFEVVPKRKTLADLRGIVKTAIRLSPDELDEAIGQAAGARWRRFIEQDREGRD